MTTSSMHLNVRQIRGLNKLGDQMLPGYQKLASFSEVGAARHADRVLDHMPASDLKDLKMLLGILGVLPAFFVAGFLNFLELSPSIPTPIGAFLRFMRIGLRGLVMTLYYCDPKVHDVIGYQVQVYTDDMPRQSSTATPQDLTSRPELHV